ncbi:hypothetical protein GWK47_049089 [Chionoecetes opilio]|uniref:Uncharacterized protein n=1 Tax=Chionoecetes opilio TaxID=41210 RepID=A0A8J5CTH8_CHIOP|nr:hypothetical protein GWK47_049089 [Chionoecetes opilio]
MRCFSCGSGSRVDDFTDGRRPDRGRTGAAFVTRVDRLLGGRLTTAPTSRLSWWPTETPSNMPCPPGGPTVVYTPTPLDGAAGLQQPHPKAREAHPPILGQPQSLVAQEGGQAQLDPRHVGSEVTRRRTGPQAAASGPASPGRPPSLSGLKAQAAGRSACAPQSTPENEARKSRRPGTCSHRLPPTGAPRNNPKADGALNCSVCVGGPAQRSYRRISRGNVPPCEMPPVAPGDYLLSCPPPAP